jgi:hypothetical protein
MSRKRRIAFAGTGGEAHDAPITRPLRHRVSRWHVVVAGALLAALLVGALAWRNRPLTNPAIADSSAITAEQLEQQYGVQLDVVGLLASGGLLELKFQVLDADKATALFGPAEDMPVLAVEGSTRVLKSASGMKHNFEILEGASYFFLYTNVANAVHEGSEVAFVINGIRIPHLVVQR